MSAADSNAVPDPKASTVRRRLSADAEPVNPVSMVHVWRSPASSAVDLMVITHLSVYGGIHEQAVAAMPNETGGFLLGRVSREVGDGCWLVEIDEVVPIEAVETHPTELQFSWRDVDRVRHRREQHGKAVVGWFHTHPDFGVFLSETDLERTHRVLFSDPFQVALVYDPVRGVAGYFFWEAPQRIDTAQASWREFAIAVDSDDVGGEPAQVEDNRS